MVGALKAGILGGIVLFVWGYISWMMIPWHANTTNQFQSDVAVSQIILANAPVSGIYMLPAMKADGTNASSSEPAVFASVKLEGMPGSMTMPMVIGFLLQVIAATLVAWLLTRTNRLGYFGKVGFVFIVALVATMIKDLSAWNWMGFDTHYTLVMIADTLIGWLLAGLVMAKVIR